MKRRTAWIFTLGTEVVRGQVTNTNAAFLGRRLSMHGFDVEGVVTLIDDKDLIAEFLSYVVSRYSPDLVVMTGGLGPTYDDVTLEAVAKSLGRQLRLDEKALSMIQEKLAQKSLELTRERMKMAYLPEGAEPIANPVGTAPGAFIKYGKAVLVCLPGVPREMEEMWLRYVEGFVREVSGVLMAEGSFRVLGIPEATLAPLLKKYSEEFRDTYIKSHPRGYEVSGPVVDIYISASSSTLDEAAALVREICESMIRDISQLGGEVREVRC